ncbi:MAG: aminotransferase class I/II-fold pyridoxal phosphate-dependent enzyme [Fimbriimonas sp.]|nr:aminotransferase class I/II-fold pyridoxal phosphate-dependent enzyme [Fimbriimonas sp.]
MKRPAYASVVAGLPATTPFVGPEALERRIGRTIELRLGANESPFGPSPLAIEAMQKQAQSAMNYGDPEGYVLRTEIARLIGVGIENVSLGAGIDELLGLCCRLFVDPGSRIVTTLGSYPTFDYVASSSGAVLVRVPYHNESIDLGALADSARRSGARIAYLANPDNPSGSWHPNDSLAELRRGLPGNCVLLLDEAYCDFAPETPPIDPTDLQVLRLRTFSKVYGMAGMRIGYIVGHADHIRALDKIRLHFGVNIVAQAGALAALRDPQWVADVVTKTTMGRAELGEFFRGLALRPLTSHTNFLTIAVGSRAYAEAILDALLRHGVFIRKPGHPPLDGCIRVTIGRPEQRARFEDIFRQVLTEI